MVGTRHIPPSSYVKLKNLNPDLPSQSLRKFYWENQEVKASLEGNSKNWKVFKKGKKLREQTNSNKKGTNSKSKSQEGPQVIIANTSLESPTVKSSQMLKCQGFPCPEQSTSTWPNPTIPNKLTNPPDFTDFLAHDPFEQNLGEVYEFGTSNTDN